MTRTDPGRWQDVDADIAAVQLSVPAAARAMRAAARAAAGHDPTLLDPPHISLGYPWRPDVDLNHMARVAARMPAPTVRLDEVAVWGDRPVVHLPAAPVAPLRVLADELGWPDLDDLAPHVSLVRLDDPPQHVLDAVVAAARAEVPGAVVVTDLEVSIRRDGTWRRVRRWRLGMSG